MQPQPLRGRSEPMERALSVVRAARRHGSGGVVLVSGPAGIGKSALLAEVCSQAGRIQVRPALGTCDPIEQVSPGAPVITALRAGREPLVTEEQYAGIVDALHEPLLLVERIAAALGISGGAATAWAGGPELAPQGSLGANGLKVHKDAVWVTNTSLGTITRIPIRRHGAAGTFETKATGLPGIDDFAFIPGSDRIIAALDSQNKVAIVEPNGRSTIALTGRGGLENPTSIAVRGHTVYITSATWSLRKDPNLIIARLP